MKEERHPVKKPPGRDGRWYHSVMALLFAALAGGAVAVLIATVPLPRIPEIPE